MVKVLVGQRPEGGGAFEGFWAEFEGEKISSYKVGDDVVHTLYRCTAYTWEAYRVHVSDETDPTAPKYELHPFAEKSSTGRLDYTEPYDKEQLAYRYPLFLKSMEHFNTRQIDPGRKF